jgi:hypothetical protein
MKPFNDSAANNNLIFCLFVFCFAFFIYLCLQEHQSKKRGAAGPNSRVTLTRTKKGGVSIMAGAKVSSPGDEMPVSLLE